MEPKLFKMRLFILLIVGIWLGIVLGISFMEAPLKFKAPNMTTEIAIGLGQMVFRALNKVDNHPDLMVFTCLRCKSN